MNIQEINQLTHASLNKLTSDAYKEAFENPQTGDAFRKRVDEIQNTPRPATRPAGNVRGEEPAVPSAQAFDPSFDDEPAPVAAPAAAQPAAQPAAPGTLSIWRYWPTDSQGRKIGGEQVFKFDPSLPNEHPQSLASQLTKAHSHATTALKARKTQEFLDSVKPDATGYKEPRLLTISDHPEAEALNAMTENAMNNAVMSALSLFKQRHSEFVLGEANAVAMCQWVAKSGRNPADGQTWEAAWVALKPFLLTDEATPAAAVTAPAPVAAAPPAPVAAAAAVPTVRRGGVATGISNADIMADDDVFATPVKVQGVKLLVDGKAVVTDLRTWDRQSSDFQKRALRNPNNAAAVNALYERQAQEQAAARSGR